MLEWHNITKQFGGQQVLDGVSMEVEEGSVLGLAGTNGAGKSTLLRIAADVYKADSGSLLLDGKPLTPALRQDLFYISDDPVCFRNGTLQEMRDFYRTLYPRFEDALFRTLTDALGLDRRQKATGFSKGMLRQAFICLAFASHARVVLFDETFDGLDPVMRQVVKGLIAQRTEEGSLLPVIASHNLRELEDIADRVAVLHRGRIVTTLDLNEEQPLVKVQCAFKQPPEREKFADLGLLQWDARGMLVTFTASCSRKAAEKRLEETQPVFSEFINLTLEEIFIAQMEGVGYEAKNILL